MPSYAYIVSNFPAGPGSCVSRGHSPSCQSDKHTSASLLVIPVLAGSIQNAFCRCWPVVAGLAATLLTTAFTNLFTPTNVITQTFINGMEINFASPDFWTRVSLP